MSILCGERVEDCRKLARVEDAETEDEEEPERDVRGVDKTSLGKGGE